MKKMILLAAVLGLTSALTASAADAKANWTSLCVKCHGEDGKGQTPMGTRTGVKDLTDAKVQDAMKDDAMAKSLKEGMKNADGKTLMNPFTQLSDEDIKALVAYVRGLKK